MLYLDHVVEHEKKRGEKNEKKKQNPKLLKFSSKDPPDSTPRSCCALLCDFLNIIWFIARNVQARI